MIHKNLESIYEKYDSFLIDVYGVLYNGNDFYDGILSTLEKIRKSGRKIVILSNTTLVTKTCQTKYAEKGLLKNIHYDEFLSSGEAFKCTVSQHTSGAKHYFQLYNKNYDIFENSLLTESDTIEKADFIYVGFLNKYYIADNLIAKNGCPIAIEDITSTDCHDIEGLEEIAKTLDICYKHNKLLVVINPDIFAPEAIKENDVIVKKLALCQGAIGEFYEKMGGKVLYFGKPYPAIYDFAKQFLVGYEKTAMIGDTLWTDILGGNMAGVDTILTLTGVSREFFRPMDERLSIEEKINILLTKISPKMIHKTLKNLSQIPTHIIEGVAGNLH